VAVGYLNIPALIFRKKNKTITVPSEEDKNKNRTVLKFILLGIFAGVIAGMFGKGGGLVIVPMLVKFYRYDPKAASATSLAALQLPVGLPSVIVYAHNGHLNFLFAGLMALGIVFGVFFGSKLALNLSASLFKKIYAFFLLFVAVYMVVKFI